MKSMRSMRERVSEAEWDLRVNLAACYRLVAKYGMTDLIYNHITARVPGPEHHILISGYGMLYEEVTASSLIKVDLAGNIIEKPDHGYSVNAAGYIIHSAVHRAVDHEAGAVHGKLAELSLGLVDDISVEVQRVEARGRDLRVQKPERIDEEVLLLARHARRDVVEVQIGHPIHVDQPVACREIDAGLPLGRIHAWRRRRLRVFGVDLRNGVHAGLLKV